MIGLLGGVWALLSRGQPRLLPLAFAALVGFLAVAYFAAFRRSPDIGINTEMAALVTFSLGALAGRAMALRVGGSSPPRPARAGRQGRALGKAL